MKRFTYLLLLTFLTFSISEIKAQNRAFPGAEGYGSLCTGGRGGDVYIVTNLNDAGTGSLRAAIQATGPRIVVFEVGGTIALQSPLKIVNPNLTIAGQTAPGDGICIRNYPVYIEGSQTNYNNGNPDECNVIIRYMRFRLGDSQKTEDDAFKGRRGMNIILDHCSVSWSVDECASWYDNKFFTMQYCLISESLYHSLHDKGDHGYGGIWGGQGATFHHNLLADHTSRNPRFCGSRYTGNAAAEKIDHRNNVIYNWGGNSCYAAEGGSYNIVNNYYKYGPATNTSIRDRIISPNADDGTNTQEAGVWGQFYINGNYVWGSTGTTSNNWDGVDGVTDAEKSAIKLSSPFEMSFYSTATQSAIEAYEYVLANVGCVIPVRDTIDTRIIEETRTGTAKYGGVYGAGTGIIDSQTQVEGHILYRNGTPPTDTDRDGMPDEWEKANGLDTNDASDAVLTNVSGTYYTNIEVYINSIVESHEFMVRPINFSISDISDKDVTLSWDDIADNEKYFVIERRHNDSTEYRVIDSVEANVETFTDTTIVDYSAYYYRIFAKNDHVTSLYSDVRRANVIETGIPVEDNGISSVKIFPNPFSDAASIMISVVEPTNLKLTLYTVSGKEIQILADGMKQVGEYQYDISGNNLDSGIYLLHVSTNNTSKVIRLIKQ